MIQTYKGHVTIIPNASFNDYLNLIENVSPEDFKRSMQHTYIKTIQKMAHIRSLYGIEREFDRYFLRLKQKLSCSIQLRHDKDLIKYQISKALEEENI